MVGEPRGEALSRVPSERAADSFASGLVQVDGEVSCSKGPSPDGGAVGMVKGAGRTVTGERGER